VEKDILEVGDETVGGRDVSLKEREERALVFLVPDNHGDRSKLALLSEEVRRLCQDLAVGTGEVGERDRVVGQDGGDGVSSPEELLVG